WFPRPADSRRISLGIRWGFSIVGSPPSRGRRSCAHLFRAALPCLALTALNGAPAAAQSSLTPDLFNPNRGGFISTHQLPTRRPPAEAPPNRRWVSGKRPTRRKKPQPGPPAPPPTQPAPSRIGQLPTYDLQPASGAAASGYDSLNRKRKQPKYYPGQAKP